MLTQRGQIEVGGSLRDALARLRRRRAAIREQLGVLEAEDADLGKVEAAVALAAEMFKAAGPPAPSVPNSVSQPPQTKGPLP
jgi:hypothetical protein